MIPLPEKKYDVIYADPPWGYQNRGTRSDATESVWARVQQGGGSSE